MFKTKKQRKILLVAIDLAILLSAYALSFILTCLSDGDIGRNALTFLVSYAVFAVFIMATRFAFRIYSNVWRYANSLVYFDMVLADAVGSVIAFIVTYLIGGYAFLGGWRAIATASIFCLLSLISRFFYQQNYKLKVKRVTDNGTKVTVAIVGAGRVGSLLAEELITYKGSHYRPVCFIDNSPNKVGSRVMGLPVYAEDGDIFEKLAAFPVQEVFIAIPQLDGDRAKAIHEYFSREGYRVKLYDFSRNTEDGTARSRIRDFKIEDLLCRNSIQVDSPETMAFYRDKTVLVTGGGGSIGSELSRKIAAASPKKLIIFDIYENNAYDIQQELLRKYKGELDLVVEIGSVRDRARLDALFAAYRPEVVFHAAAHKHVPLMEHSNAEAIKNNVLGTYNTADMAEKYGAKKFILISTDKAVNPTNVMGASKRMCEMVIQCRTDSETTFCAVRFGNVLGSNGSVIPLFNKQIASGGPVTITDKRIIRYFMTIPEASGLVLTAGAMAKCGELFVLDMGKPVKIYDLAENMIKLSGLRPHTDIEIIETGLRPGEKLSEELLIKTEELEKTDNDLIFIERDKPLSRECVEDKLEVLREAVKANEGVIASGAITAAMKSVVPTFYSPEELNKSADEAEEMKNVSDGHIVV